MKKGFILIALILLMGAIALFCTANADMGGGNAAYLRVHIRADSNEAAAQSVKYRVRDEVVAFLTPVVAECETKAEAMEKIRENLFGIETVADRVLKVNGFPYRAKASLRREQFPTRVYENVTLEAGVYDALILELGSGKGDNWWCVVYPPLCFSAGGGNVVYKSKIAEIIRDFFAK